MAVGVVFPPRPTGDQSLRAPIVPASLRRVE
jgi:hypothetical protein